MAKKGNVSHINLLFNMDDEGERAVYQYLAAAGQGKKTKRAIALLQLGIAAEIAGDTAETTRTVATQAPVFDEDTLAARIAKQVVEHMQKEGLAFYGNELPDREPTHEKQTGFIAEEEDAANNALEMAMLFG